MSSHSDLSDDFEKLKRDATQMVEENARLRSINAKMAAALRYLLPLLQQGLPATVDFDWTEEAVAKVQDALAEAERDP
jgi:regulator of replication initiation timing